MRYTNKIGPMYKNIRVLLYGFGNIAHIHSKYLTVLNVEWNWYDPYIKNNSLGRITEIPDYQELTVRSPDFLNLLFGTTETRLREQRNWVPFLNHNAYINNFCAVALRNVEIEILTDEQRLRPET